MFLFIFLVVAIIAGIGSYLFLHDDDITIKGKDVGSAPIGMAICIGDGVFAIAYLVYIVSSWFASLV